MTKAPSSKMPLGMDDFKKLIETDCFFVDKSKLIIDILGNRSEVTLITRPRRFGKTLNLSMLRYFFDVNGKEEHRKLFAGLAVSRDKQAMSAMGQYPVLMLSLKGIKAASLEEQLDDFKTLMKKLYDEHTYLYDHLTPNEMISFDRVCQEQVNASQLASSLEELIKFIARYHDKKVVVLLDEYDCPLLSAFHRGFEKDFNLFYRKFMGHAFKGNVAVQFAVVTGVMQMAGSGMFSDFNNADIFNLLDEPYATAFGFTEEEVKTLLLAEQKPEKLEEVRRWYNGYLFGKKAHVIYNPWSVLKYISRDCAPDVYWAYTSDNLLLQKELYSISDATRAEFTALMATDGKVSVVFDNSLLFSEMGMGKKQQPLWVLLLSSGHLKARVDRSTPGGGGISTDLSIPNEEVRFIYHRLFHNWLIEKLGSEDRSKALLMQLVEGHIGAFCQDLETFFMESVSVHDVRSDTVETFYHGFILGLLGLMNQTHIGHLRSNGESGLGRFDITFEPRDPKKGPAIVFELKRLEHRLVQDKTEKQIKQSLQCSAKEGFDQIKAKAYGTDLMARGMQTIAYISLAFSGKQIAYKYEEPTVIDMR